MLFLFFGAVFGDDFRVACVGSSTICGFAGSDTLAEVFCHQAVFEIAKAGAFFEMVFGQEHVPKPKFLGLGFQVFNDLWMGVEAGNGALADLLLEDGIGGDAFLLDKFLDLYQAVKMVPLENKSNRGLFYQIQSLLCPLTHPWASNDWDSFRCGDVASGTVEKVGNRHVERLSGQRDLG